MTPPLSVDVVLPVLDEARAIPWVLARMPMGYRPIVVDNGSRDGSATVAAEHGATVIAESRIGFGAACWAGLCHASGDIVAFMDCDGSLDPAALPEVVGPIASGSADLVLGARVSEPGAWPLHARAANRWLAREVRRRTRSSLTDIGPMRAARRQPLLDLGLVDRRSGWPLEMVLVAAAAGWSIDEVRVPYLRRTGRSKVTGTIRGTAHAVRDMRRQLRATARD
jgi:glycosyltransferase involved in cell wall biosynthesis